MSFAYIEDKGGKTIKFAEMDGRLYPAFNPDSLQHARTMEARPDDILLVTYPKAGTHWAFEIIRFLLAGTTDLPSCEKDVYMVEDAARDFINKAPSPRNINSHYHVDTISQDFFRKKSKIIYITRNPRDIVTSYYNHHKKLTHIYEYDGEWKDYMPLFLEAKLDYDSWFEHSRNWEKCIRDHPDHPFLVLSYEGMKGDPLGNIKKIAHFIGTDRSEDFLKEIAEKTDFASMLKARQIAQKKEEFIMYRKGKVGDWKNKFTVAQSEMFNEVFEREMAGTNAYKLYSHTAQDNTDENKNV